MNPSEPQTRPLKPLDDLLVLDLSRVLSGPYCSMNLADMGARVIKVEQPGSGDDTRGFGPPFVNGESTYFMSVNRNKESVTLNMKHPEGQALLWQLVERADVLIENFRPGVMARLGFSYEACLKRNPRLIYCSISGFGQSGLPAFVKKPGYDLVIQGLGGIQSVTGEKNGPPFKSGAAIADIISGMLAFQGILLALLARGRTGRGQQVDISMLDGQVSFLTFLAGIYFATGRIPSRVGNQHQSIVPYATFAASDGYLNLAVGNEALWEAFCEVIGQPELRKEARFATNAQRVTHRADLELIIDPLLRARTVAEWVKAFDLAGIPCGEVLSIGEVLEHPQVNSRQMVVPLTHPVAGPIRVTGVPVKLSETPGAVLSPPPSLGQHTQSTLQDLLGLTEAELLDLRSRGVV